MNSPVDKIKEKLSIMDVVSSYISIEKAGKNYKAKCPFHNEKTPSFFISSERDAYYCFGCGAKGDIFSFVEQFEGLDFLGALKLLAERAGVTLTYEKNNKLLNDKEKYYKILEDATVFFENNLEKTKEVQNYLKNRGLLNSTIKLFRIGYVRNEWRLVLDYLLNKGYKREDLEIVGLIKKPIESPEEGSTESQNKFAGFYDRFRGRIMFPICDSTGRVIAFSGRIFPETNNKEVSTEVGTPTILGAKYINSPDTPLFNKSNVLFGIDKAKSSIRSRSYTIIVEGQVDLILSHQAGFTNTVAVSGTALIDNTGDTFPEEREQKVNNFGLIRRLSQNIIFAFDGDSAGIRASSRGAMIALSLDMQVKIAILPPDKDPADILLNDQNKWKDIIKNSVNIISFHINNICEKTNDIHTRGRQIRETIFPFLVVIKSSIERSAYINEIHQKTNISANAIIEDFEKYIQDKQQARNSEKESEKIDQKSRRVELEKRFFGIVFWLENTKDKNINELCESFKNEIGEEIYKKMYEHYKNNSPDLAFQNEIWYGGKTEIILQDMKEIVLNLEEEILNERLVYLTNKINQEEKANHSEEIEKILGEYQKIIGRIENIKYVRAQ